MFVHERTRHGGMTTPAEKAYICPETDVIRPVLARVRFFCMTKQAYRLVVNAFDPAGFVPHYVGINRSILLFGMAIEANSPPIGIWSHS